MKRGLTRILTNSNIDAQNYRNAITMAEHNTNDMAYTPSNYDYYTDGSVKKDDGKGIGNGGITYNFVQLASTIVAGATTYQYTYAATGQKLTMTDGTKTYNYIGNAVYLNNQLEFAATPEGRWLPKEQLKQYNPDKTPVTPPSGAGGALYGRFEYTLKDHLGNSRVACRCVEKNTATATADQAYLPVETTTDHYDPWGASLNDDLLQNPIPPTNIPSINSPLNRYTYNGKELQKDIGLFEYGFRWYDPNIARFISVDPLAEKYPYYTQYQYAGNKPIRFIDLDGLEEAELPKVPKFPWHENGMTTIPEPSASAQTPPRIEGKLEAKLGPQFGYLEKFGFGSLGVYLNAGSLKMADFTITESGIKNELDDKAVVEMEVEVGLAIVGGGLKESTFFNRDGTMYQEQEYVLSLGPIEVEMKNSIKNGESNSEVNMNYFTTGVQAGLIPYKAENGKLQKGLLALKAEVKMIVPTTSVVAKNYSSKDNTNVNISTKLIKK